MYAIIADSGRQYKVEEGQELEVDLRADATAGTTITFDRVLLISGGAGGVQIGEPTVAGASVSAEVLAQTQGEKVTIQKFRRRKNYRRKTGHRQMYTKVRVNKIAV